MVRERFGWSTVGFNKPRITMKPRMRESANAVNRADMPERMANSKQTACEEV
jgi:hypothetical protein